LVAGAAVVAASARRHQELPPCCTETVSAGFKTDPPLAKGEPLSNAGRTSVITYLRKGKNTAQKQEERSETT